MIRKATILLALLLSAGAAHADIYAFTDENGTPHFSNVPQDKRYVLFLRTPQVAASVVPLPGNGKAAFDPAKRKLYGPYVEAAAKSHHLEAALLHAVISAESGYNPGALSRKGAIGLMQLMPETIRRYGVINPYDPGQNIRGGALYLRDLLRKFNNDLKLTLAAYNAGEDAVVHHGNRVPPFPETLLYVPRVLDFYRRYQGETLNPLNG